MQDTELVKLLRTASESIKSNIPISMLLKIAADRIEQYIQENET